MGNIDRVPRHVAIIMDGNGRWAKERGKERTFGHVQGAESVRNAVKSARRLGISYLTLYVFSTENWGRPQEEVYMLMELFCKSVVDEMDELRSQGVSVKVIGNRNGIPAKVAEHIEKIETGTAGNTDLTLILALDYSSRSEIVRAANIIAESAAAGKIKPGEITEETISGALYTSGVPDPDLIIRTGGEERLSNFLLWQAAYSELYFTDTYWPDFGPAEFDEAIADYSARERRFGLVRQETYDKQSEEK